MSARADEIAALYAQQARLVQRQVARRVNAPTAVIEDACQAAWERLCTHPDVDLGGPGAVRWLVITEQRAALGAGTRIAAAVARLRSPATTRMPVSVTFGAATSRPGDLPDTLLERADQALLDAKHRARASRRPNR